MREINSANNSLSAQLLAMFWPHSTEREKSACDKATERTLLFIQRQYRNIVIATIAKSQCHRGLFIFLKILPSVCNIGFQNKRSVISKLCSTQVHDYKKFGPSIGPSNREWRILQNKEIYKSYKERDIVAKIKSKKLKLTIHIMRAPSNRRR